MRVATLFDFNGVLVDDELVHLEAFCDVLGPLGVTVTEEVYVERYIGCDDLGAFRAMLIDAGRHPSDDEVRALVEAKKPAYMARVTRSLRVFPGAAELVVRRASRGPVGIVSGALAHEIEYALERMGVRRAVSFIVSAEDTPACKPDPLGYRLGMGHAGRLGASRAMVVEDSTAGIQAAKAAGLRCVGVAHSYPAARLLAAGADVAVADLLALDDATLEGDAR